MTTTPLSQLKPFNQTHLNHITSYVKEVANLERERQEREKQEREKGISSGSSDSNTKKRGVPRPRMSSRMSRLHDLTQLVNAV